MLITFAEPMARQNADEEKAEEGAQGVRAELPPPPPPPERFQPCGNPESPKRPES